MVERLARLMQPSYIAVWLRKPVPALGEEKPIDVIARGEYMRVAQLISALEETPLHIGHELPAAAVKGQRVSLGGLMLPAPRARSGSRGEPASRCYEMWRWWHERS
jgi:hypothetical protein